MRAPRTLSGYVVREVLTYTSLGLVAITIVMVTQNLFRFVDEMISAGVDWRDFAAIITCLALMLATYTVPIAFLMGVVLAISRLAADAEIIAMRACGLGLRSLMTPIVILGILLSGVTAFLNLEVEHVAQLALRRVVKTMAARGGFVEPGRFRRLGERMLFVKSVDNENRLEGVLISDRTDPERPMVIFAERGKLSWDSDRDELNFRLTDGDIHIEPNGEQDSVDGVPDFDYQRISFLSFDYTLAASTLFGRNFSTLRPREMTMAQLRQVIARANAGEGLEDLRRKDPMHYRLQIQRRIALPFAPLLFAFVGVPLGLERRRGARSWGIFLCVTLVFGYYAILTFSEFLAMQRILPPAAALWMANGVFALAAAGLLRRASQIRD